MKSLPSLCIFLFLAFTPALALAGATCVAETNSGKVVKLEIVSVGTAGGFEKATLTVMDRSGEVLFEDVYEEAGQHAATVHEGKAIVVFTTYAADSDVFLTFVGENQDEYDNGELLKILRDPDRKKDVGNRLSVSIYVEGKEEEFRFEDIVVTLHKDV